MEEIRLDDIFSVSEDVVVREIEGELIIVPLVAGIGDMEDELYTLNETGKDILKAMDGKNSLKTIAGVLGENYTASLDEIESDVVGLVTELAQRRMVVKLG